MDATTTLGSNAPSATQPSSSSGLSNDAQAIIIGVICAVLMIAFLALVVFRRRAAPVNQTDSLPLQVYEAVREILGHTLTMFEGQIHEQSRADSTITLGG